MDILKALSLYISASLLSREGEPACPWLPWEVASCLFRGYLLGQCCSHESLDPGMRSSASFGSSVSQTVIPVSSLCRLNER